MNNKTETALKLADCLAGNINEIKQAISHEIIEKILAIAMARKGDFAEIYFEHAVTNAIVLEDNKIRQAQSGTILGAGIRVIAGEKTGYAYSDSIEFDHLKQAALAASYIAGTNQAISDYAFNASPTAVKNLSPIDIYPGDVAIKEKSDLLWRANKAGYEFDNDIKQVNCSFVDSLKFYRIANTMGTIADNQESLCRLNVSVIIEKNNIRQSGYHGAGGRVGFSFYDNSTPENIAGEAARIATVKLAARQAPAGPQPVVLHKGWAGILLHEAVGHGLEADFNRKKTSLYSDRIGQKVASNLCTIIDDGTLPNLRGTLNIDDEGHPTGRNVLIEKGILKGYLSDCLNARLMKIARTGSGRRESYRHYPMPRMTNTFMLPGDSQPGEIIKSVKKGIFAKSFGGGQVDISNGQFVFEITEGYLIEDGNITAPVKGATLIGSGPEILERVEMVGNDLEFDPGIGTCGKNGQSVPVGVGIPTCKISEITVGGTTMAGVSLAEGKV
jgi:TldD protein